MEPSPIIRVTEIKSHINERDPQTVKQEQEQKDDKKTKEGRARQLENLGKMHRQGRVSFEEMERLRRIINGEVEV